MPTRRSVHDLHQQPPGTPIEGDHPSRDLAQLDPAARSSYARATLIMQMSTIVDSAESIHEVAAVAADARYRTGVHAPAGATSHDRAPAFRENLGDGDIQDGDIHNDLTPVVIDRAASA